MTTNETRDRLLLRRCAAAGVALILAVIVTSAYLRLTQAGLGCADWPDCYGASRALASAPIETSFSVTAMRLVHRIAAAGVGFVVIVIAALAFAARRSDAPALRLAGALAALTVSLAVLGRATPGAQIIAVTLGNLLGGMAMLALMEWLRLRASSAATAAPVKGALAILVGVAMIAFEIVLGAWVTANYAGASCTTFPHCHGKWWPPSVTLELMNPWHSVEPLPASALVADPARQGLNLLHRAAGAMVLAYWLALVAAIGRESRALPAVMLTAALLLLQFAAGYAIVALDLPLALAVMHNALAALLVLAAVNAAFHSRSAEAAKVSAACQIVISK
ncbi:MAG: COX15/CtaA family protein [Betaproteobacteria bacterium]